MTSHGGTGVDQLAVKLEFFVFCARLSVPADSVAAPVDEQRIFDNSMHRVSNAVPAYAQSSGLAWEPAYEEYLATRVRSFALGSDLTSIDVLRMLGVRDQHLSPTAAALLAELVALLSAQEPAESRALERRIAQLPSDVVFHEWYRDRDAFDTWVERLAVAGQDIRAEHLAAFTAAGYHALVQAWRAGDERGLDVRLAETVDAMLGQTAAYLSAHLRGEAGLPADVVAGLTALEPIPPEGYPLDEVLPRSVLLRVQLEFARRGAGSSADLITRFVVALAFASGCQVCDFLRYEDELLLRPVAISNAASPIAALAKKPYLRAQGIAGSAALLSEDVTRRWVGTNFLRDDPRQSRPHSESWTKATGDEINDYWVLPVFLEHRLYGAFRVFNRLASRWTNGIPWPESILWELREVSEWCGTVLLPRLGDDVGVRAVTETVHSSAVQRLKSFLALEWIDEDFLVTLVTHVTTVVHRVVEAQSLGCCIGVFANPESVVQHSSSYYAAGAVTFSSETVHHLREAADAYQKINPASGLFVFDASGAGRGVRRIGAGQVVGRTAVEGLSAEHRPSLILLLDRGQDCMLLVKDGKVVADYYLAQVTGEWVLRIYSELAATCVAHRPASIPEDYVHDVLQRAMELSYARVGAMLILGDGLPTAAYFEHESTLSNVNLRSLTTSEFSDMAALDGAVHIEPSRGVTAVGALVRTRDSAPAPHRAGMEGSRHSSAAAFSAVTARHLVVVVSENRTVTVMVGGTLVLERV